MDYRCIDHTCVYVSRVVGGHIKLQAQNHASRGTSWAKGVWIDMNHVCLAAENKLRWHTGGVGCAGARWGVGCFQLDQLGS
jgi:hypothetical protein